MLTLLYQVIFSRHFKRFSQSASSSFSKCRDTFSEFFSSAFWFPATISPASSRNFSKGIDNFQNISSLFSECGDNFSWFSIRVFEVLCWFPLVFYSCFRRFASLWLIFLLRFSRKCVHNSMFFARTFRSFVSIFFDLSHFWGEFRLLGIMKAVIKAVGLGAKGAQKPRGSPSGRVVACFVNGWFISDLKILIKK